MSGGCFNYEQHRCEEIASKIDELIKENHTKNEWGYANNYSEEIIEKFNETAYNLRRAGEMAQRVDWLASGDDDENSFIERWKDEVRKEWKPKLELCKNIDFDYSGCPCWRCLEENKIDAWWMVVCPKCGNKRCPHASDHNYDCTDSNKSGQKGSIYQ